MLLKQLIHLCNIELHTKDGVSELNVSWPSLSTRSTIIFYFLIELAIYTKSFAVLFSCVMQALCWHSRSKMWSCPVSLFSGYSKPSFYFHCHYTQVISINCFCAWACCCYNYLCVLCEDHIAKQTTCWWCSIWYAQKRFDRKVSWKMYLLLPVFQLTVVTAARAGLLCHFYLVYDVIFIASRHGIHRFLLQAWSMLTFPCSTSTKANERRINTVFLPLV